ncbi:DUF6125 family protein [Desulfovibrio ferrophilus]|uniref:Cytosolic protein n=1 Tax=Desulfovibrio ferrophilus TaxID=241368 RepID=A0A2Z6B004_9BACT|nr:DUF6125 family protein [Desulfovibrio ferrophilus]BBD08824.1 uncharacterized protein DFE_2098 [Desulfovibrio ferrophilus]
MSEKRDELIGQIIETVRQTGAHYGLWLAEAVHQMGLERALEAEAEAGDRLTGIVERKLAKVLGGEGLKDLFAGLDETALTDLGKELRTAWLAADGVWFQAVEGMAGMDDAKRVNDTCWSRFAPLEASRAMAALGLARGGGLEALKECLAQRMYAHINDWEIVDETPTSFIFRMNRCRVQTARVRKGLADYPCKSGGTVEYTSFARQVDPRIVTECVACPPDEHPAQWVCSWRFTLDCP